jgi:hypothetical protein
MARSRRFLASVGHGAHAEGRLELSAQGGGTEADIGGNCGESEILLEVLFQQELSPFERLTDHPTVGDTGVQA